MSEHERVVHVSAESSGVGSGPLRDASLLSGLLIASAGAAGLSAAGAPAMRVSPAGAVSAVLQLESGHASVHSFPQRGLALVDIMAHDEAGAAKALDVFVRRLAPTGVNSETWARA